MDTTIRQFIATINYTSYDISREKSVMQSMKVAQSPFLEIGPLQKVVDPFPYAYTSKALDGDLALNLLGWLEDSAPWRLRETDFYEQYEFNFYEASLPSNLAFITSSEYLSKVKDFIEDTFNVNLDEHIDVTAHKLLPGQTIRIHNDFIPGLETHRILIQLNRSWPDENGGMLVLFNSDDPKDIHKIMRPAHNSLVAFEISHKSNHAVSTIHQGERFTLVYSFHRSEE